MSVIINATRPARGGRLRHPAFFARRPDDRRGRLASMDEKIAPTNINAPAEAGRR
jgi:hypothetical protein